MHEQLQEAERNKQIRLQPKQGIAQFAPRSSVLFLASFAGDQLSLKNALNILGRRSTVAAKKTSPVPKIAESSQTPHKGHSVIDTHLKTLFINQQPPTRVEIVAHPKASPMSSVSHSANGRAIESQESARSRPYNSNFSFLFEGKEVGSLHQEIMSRGHASRGHLPHQSISWTSNQISESTDQPPSNLTSNVLMIQTPHPPASQLSENAAAGVAAKRRKFVVISTADFHPTKDAELKDHCLPSRPQSHKSYAANQKPFETHVASSPRKAHPTAVALSAAKTEPKQISPELDRTHSSDLFIGSKDAREARELQLNGAIKNPARIKGAVTHTVGFQIDQVGPPLDRDLGRDDVSFSMSPWK